jgi:hypothetical protein
VMRQIIFILGFLFASTFCFSQACSTNPGAGVTCACNVQWDANHVTAPVGNTNRVYDVCYANSLGLHNTQRIGMFLHGGGYAGKLHDSGDYPPAANITSLVLNNGSPINLYLVEYTVILLGQLTEQLDPGDTSMSLLSVFGTQWESLVWWPTGAGNGFTATVDTGADAENVTITATSGSYSSATWTIGGHGPTRTHPAGTFVWNPATSAGVGSGWPAAETDIASFTSFVAQCSTGGLTPGTGVCSGFSSVPGNPQHIVEIGGSAGGLLGLRFLQAGCNSGATCPYLVNTPGAIGYTSWTAKSWRVSNPVGTSSIGYSDALDPAAIYVHDLLLGRQNDLGGFGNIAMCECVPECTDFDNTTTISCLSGPNACYTSCTNTMSPLAISRAGTPIPVSGWTCAGDGDTDFYQADVEMGTQPHMTTTVYPHTAHGCNAFSNTTNPAWIHSLMLLGPGASPGSPSGTVQSSDTVGPN